jgi:hypothetical protein
MRAYWPPLVLLASIWGASYLFIMPASALFYGSTIPDEPLTAAAPGGLVLILAGVTLASGQRVLWPRVQGETV